MATLTKNHHCSGTLPAFKDGILIILTGALLPTAKLLVETTLTIDVFAALAGALED